MECWEFGEKNFEADLLRVFSVISQDHGKGYVLTSQCEINGAPALGRLLRITPDTPYTLTETGFTLETRMLYVEAPSERKWALDKEVRARLQFPLDCHIRVNFRDICLAFAIGPCSEQTQRLLVSIVAETITAMAAMWARAYAEWQARWNRPPAARRARRSQADGNP